MVSVIIPLIIGSALLFPLRSVHGCGKSPCRMSGDFMRTVLCDHAVCSNTVCFWWLFPSENLLTLLICILGTFLWKKMTTGSSGNPQISLSSVTPMFCYWNMESIPVSELPCLQKVVISQLDQIALGTSTDVSQPLFFSRCRHWGVLRDIILSCLMSFLGKSVLLYWNPGTIILF